MVRPIFLNPSVITMMIALALAGGANSSFQPYQSVIAINTLGIEAWQYSLLVTVGGFLSIIYSLVTGALSDGLFDRRVAVSYICVLAAAGAIGIFTFGSAMAFTLATVLTLPLIPAVITQSFGALGSLKTDNNAKSHARLLSFGRVVLSASWVVIPPCVALLISISGRVEAAYALTAILLLIVAAQIFVPNARWRGVPQTGKRLSNLIASLNLLRSGHVVVPVLANSLCKGALRLQQIILGLIVVNQLGGTISDVGFIAAITALCEIPFILLWMLVSEKIGRNRSMLVGASIYAAYFVFLWFAPSTTYVFAITPLAALGGACLLSLAIAFLQDVIPERPALSTALMSISDFNSWVVAASLFYVSSLFSDKVPMTLLGALLSVCGGLAIAATKERSHRRTASA